MGGGDIVGREGVKREERGGELKEVVSGECDLLGHLWGKYVGCWIP